MPDPSHVPTYTAAEAARLVGLGPARVSHWLRGSTRKSAGGGGTRRRRPLIRRGPSGDEPYVSFLDLIELRFIKAFLDIGIGIRKLCRALEEAVEIAGRDHPFAHQVFFTDGREIYLSAQAGNRRGLLQLCANGQWVIPEVILRFATEIEFSESTGLPERWHPLGPELRVAIDPRVAFGAPTVTGHGVKTSNVYDFYLAEECDVRRVAEWFDLAPSEVEAAVEFEQAQAA